MPCNFNVYQNMRMACSSGSAIFYSLNQLVGEIGTSTVSSWKAGNFQSRSY